MLPRAYCQAKAEECDLNADAMPPGQAEEWRRMAAEWRVSAAAMPFDQIESSVVLLAQFRTFLDRLSRDGG